MSKKRQKKKKRGLIACVGSLVIVILVGLVKSGILGSAIQTVGNYFIHKEELKITTEKECRDKMNEYYSEHIKTHEHLREDIAYIQDMYSKWNSNNYILPSEDEGKLKHIFSNLAFILEGDEGNNLKQKMERWLKRLVPSINDDVENYKRLKEQMDQGTTINPDKVRTPDAGPLPELTEAMEAYDTYFKDFMNNKVQKCANGDK
ncbi:hypothetical protein [uncultured Solobacterium sp.]|jgi:hypothetical protein|uniref:hypothetical protein n=1 Tax=uncultured Solobacterium sp. TaxID=747375 RepID=UPI0028D17A16|nr:hypothetical protein [uncultured Solobacterium sp.]